MRVSLLRVLAAIGFAFGSHGLSSVAAAQAATGPTAAAEVYDSAGQYLGTANFWQAAEGVRMDATLHGVASGWHGVYIDTGGRCDPSTFASADAPISHGTPISRKVSQVQLRDGDLMNVDDPTVGANFQTTGDTLTLHGLAPRASLGPGDAAILGPAGAAVIIQAQPDDGVTGSSGPAGNAIACGVLVADAVARDGSTFMSQPPDTQAMFRGAYGDLAAQAWVSQHDAETTAPPETAQSAPPETAQSAIVDAVADSVCATASSDPRDACELPSHAAVSGAITDVGGLQVYRFSVTAPGAAVHAHLLNLSTDYDLYLLDNDGNVVSQSVHEGTAPEAIDTQLPAGDYFLYVYAGLPVPDKAPYQLLFDIQPQSG